MSGRIWNSKAFLAFSLAAFFNLHASRSAAYEQFPESTPDPYQGKTEFNGMTLKQFGDFTKWKLITVRYRKDSNEMRFVYANPLAWKALTSKSKHFPEGSILAKIGFKSEEDSAFPSSVVPSGAARFQFMIKDKKKYMATDGWGYALFDHEGKTFGGEPKSAVTACHACHQLVADKDFVFSNPIDFAALLKKPSAGKASRLEVPTRLIWATKNISELHKSIAKFVPSEYTQAEVVSGELQKNIFLGTLNELRPALIRQTASTGRPSVIYDDAGKLFSLILPRKSESSNCPVGQKSFEEILKSSANQIEVARKPFCQ